MNEARQSGLMDFEIGNGVLGVYVLFAFFYLHKFCRVLKQPNGKLKKHQGRF